MKKIIIIFISLLFFISCSSKKDKFEDYNLSDEAWLSKIMKNIEKDELEKADNNYTSFYSEHIHSPLLKSTILILADAHASEHEYLLANFYIDEYIKLYADSNNIEWLNYLKLKNIFNGLALPKRNQFVILEALNEITKFKNEYPNSIYIPYINTMQTKLNLTQLLLNKDIQKLYKKMGYKDSVQAYNNLINENDLKDIDYIKPKLPWYRKIFE